MIEMNLPDMTCGHCAGIVLRACKRIDPDAQVDIDVRARTVKIDSTERAQDFAEELAEAGYPAAA